jgi:hypothetical protein
VLLQVSFLHFKSIKFFHEISFAKSVLQPQEIHFEMWNRINSRQIEEGKLTPYSLLTGSNFDKKIKRKLIWKRVIWIFEAKEALRGLGTNKFQFNANQLLYAMYAYVKWQVWRCKNIQPLWKMLNEETLLGNPVV